VLVALSSLLTLKKGTRYSDFQSNKPHPIWRLYDRPFQKRPILLGHNLQPLPLGSGGLSSHWWHCYIFCGLLWTKWLSHNFDRMRLGKRGCQGGREG
jgi:hypothetical protein